MAQMLTIVKAKVDSGKAPILEEQYRTMKRGSRPNGLSMPFLAREDTGHETFYIFTLWENAEALSKKLEP
jgi:heme-degrading monooxygenase HmoA